MELTPIAFAQSPYKEKFAIPRQPGLVPSARTRVALTADFCHQRALEGLEQVSHVWLIFGFHAVGSRPDSLRVRPPRLGGNTRIGVFATRSTHRPNGLGQSLVKIETIDDDTLIVSGADLLDGTPVYDIKPYVPYADALTDAENHMAPAPPNTIRVEWSPDARAQAEHAQQRLQDKVLAVIEESLAQDPRPAYQNKQNSTQQSNHDSEREYGVRLWDLNVRWHYPTNECARVIAVLPIDNEQSEK